MPQLKLEVSANAALVSDWTPLLHDIHRVLHESGGIKLENCKTRVQVAENYLVGDGSPAGAFVHLDVRFMAGRAPALKESIGQELLEVLLTAFADAMRALSLQVTVEIRDIEHANYFKFPADSFTPQ